MKKSSKVYLSVVLFALLFVLVFANAKTIRAITVEEIRAMIANLQTQIAQLQTQLANMQGVPTEWCHTFNANIGVGTKTGNPEIKALITVLHQEGLYDNPESSEGYDEALASAITGFQEKYKAEILTPLGLKFGTGYVGVATRAKLNQLYGCQKIVEAECKTDAECPQIMRPCIQNNDGTTNCPPTIKCVNGKCVSSPVVSGENWCNWNDVNKDGKVNSSDVTIARNNFGNNCNIANRWCNWADVNKDKKADETDLTIIRSNYTAFETNKCVGLLDKCAYGEKKCSGSFAQSCNDWNSDYYLEWGGSDVACPNGCENGECKPVIPSITCEDPDSAFGLPNFLSVMGTCKDQIGTYTDYSSDLDTLVEYSCVSNYCVPAKYNCLASTGFKYSRVGVCTDVAPGCVDSDGKNYFSRGYVKTLARRYYDFCFGANLSEYYCDGGDRKIESIVCEDGCFDGACIKLSLSL